MRVEPMGGSIALPEQRPQILFDVPCATEVIVKLSGRQVRRGDYPCGCRLCREATAVEKRSSSPLSAIDVYDVPDGIAGESAEYFH